MVKFRELVNGAILNEAKWIGFMGDSEYINDDGEIIMGYWALLRTIEWEEVPKDGCPYILDNEISEDELFDKNPCYAIENDNGVICSVKFYYDSDNH